MRGNSTKDKDLKPKADEGESLIFHCVVLAEKEPFIIIFPINYYYHLPIINRCVCVLNEV